MIALSITIQIIACVDVQQEPDLNQTEEQKK